MLATKGHSLVNNKIFKKKSKKGGFGLFTRYRIKKHELVIVFGGYVVTLQQLKKLPKYFHDYFYHVDDNLLIGIKKKTEFSISEYLNHSCDPSCGFKNQLCLVAMRDIYPGEEITTDYAFFVTSNTLRMKCTCGSVNCRKVIKNTDWKNLTLQRKYRNFFQPYIKEKIDKIKKK